MSDWKKSGAARRDARSQKPPDEPRPIAAKKDTKRWCKGRIGVAHDLQHYLKPTYGSRLHVLACKTCGREIDTYYEAVWSRKTKPDWVPDKK